jgi:glyoxylase-like metal-dependent hydrolase (beta-lactamase superfamily II)
VSDGHQHSTETAHHHGDGHHGHTPEPRTYAKQEQEPATEEITEVAPGVVRMQLPVRLPGLGHVNCYALEDERGIALIDPGLPGKDSWTALVARLADAGWAVRHVHTVVVTHSHFDHFGGAEQLRAEAGADVLTHEAFRSTVDARELTENPDREWDLNDPEQLEELRQRFRRKKPWGQFWQAPPDEDLRRMLEFGRGGLHLLPEPSIKVRDDQVVRLAGREWIAVHTPGHTGDHLCLYDPEHGVFVSGDHVLPTITPHIAGASPYPDPLHSFFESLRRMHDYRVKVVLPAHGHPFTDLRGRADEILRHHEDRLDVLRAAATDLPGGTVADFMRLLFRERSWGDMAESETYAHLEHLRQRGEATVAEVDGLLAYTIAT